MFGNSGAFCTKGEQNGWSKWAVQRMRPSMDCLGDLGVGRTKIENKF